MATSFHFELDNRSNRQGRYQIFLRITQNRKPTRVKTGISLAKQSDWNPHPKDDHSYIKASEPKSKLWNDNLDQLLTDTKQQYRELQQEGKGSAETIAKRLRGDEKCCDTLLAYSKSFHSKMLADKRLGSYKKYGDTLNKLESFLTKGGKVIDIPLNEVTLDVIYDFISYLQTLPNHRYKDATLHPNTISKHLRDIRAILNDAIRTGKMKEGTNPIRKGQSIPQLKEKTTFKKKLTAEQIQAITDVELKEGSRKWDARNCFLFSYYCAGIRLGDLIQLRWRNVENGRLSYQMDKNAKLTDIFLVEQARAILDRYRKDGQDPNDFIFPFLDSGAKYARYNKETMQLSDAKRLFDTVNSREARIGKDLKEVAKLAGIEQSISFHISRHSFAKQAKDMGIDNITVKDMLNHSSLSVTERYMKGIDNTEQDRALEKMFANDDESRKNALISSLKKLDAKSLEEIINQVKQA